MLIVSAALWFGITTAGLSRLLRQRPQTAHRRRCSCKWVSFSSARTLSFMGRTACSTANACGAITRSTIRPRSWNRSLRRAFTRSTWFLGSVTADVVMVLMGVSPNVLVVLGPFTIAHFGLRPRQSRLDAWPFKYVIAGPVFHRWHHTAADRGNKKNLAATFPILVVLFGTFYMPADERPDGYGVAEREFPAGLQVQLVRVHAVSTAESRSTATRHFPQNR